MTEKFISSELFILQSIGDDSFIYYYYLFIYLFFYFGRILSKILYLIAECLRTSLDEPLRL